MIAASERKDKITALSATILFHAALLLLFLYIILKTPIPPFPENAGLGIEVDFGNLTEGTGNVEDNKMGAMENNETKKPEIDNSKPNESETAVLTNDAEDESITIRKAEKTEKTETPVEKPVEKTPEEPKPSAALAEAMAKFKSRKNISGGGGDGNSGNPGNSGDPNGDPDGTGTGGNGTSGPGGYDLRGRLLLKKPEIADDSQEEGKVIVEIVVDETGKVIKATPGARGSTTTNALLYAKARQAAFSAKFNASEAKEQKGTITFVFILD